MIETSYFWICIGLLTAGTIFIRGSLIALSHRITIPGRIRELFTFIPSAVYPAIAVPMVFFHQGEVEWMAGKERLIILALAAVVSVVTRNMLITLIFGLGGLYAVTELLVKIP